MDATLSSRSFKPPAVVDAIGNPKTAHFTDTTETAPEFNGYLELALSDLESRYENKLSELQAQLTKDDSSHLDAERIQALHQQEIHLTRLRLRLQLALEGIDDAQHDGLDQKLEQISHELRELRAEIAKLQK
jgi:hypothetical protein